VIALTPKIAAAARTKPGMIAANLDCTSPKNAARASIQIKATAPNQHARKGAPRRSCGMRNG